MKSQKHSWMKAGMPLLVIGSLLICAGIITRGDIRIMNIPVSIPIAQHYSSGAFISGWIAIILGFVITMTGFLALYAFLSSKKNSLINAGALVLTLSGTGLLLPVFGTYAFTFPLVGRVYLAGQTTLMNFGPSVISGPLAVYLPVAALVYIIGIALFGIAIWQSGLISRSVGVVFFLHAPLLMNPQNPTVEVLGGLLLAITSVFFVFAVFKLKNITDR